MTNTRFLKSKIIIKGYKVAELAGILGISVVSLRNKINNRTPFKVTEITKLCEILGIKDKDSYFFSPCVDETATKACN